MKVKTQKLSDILLVEKINGLILGFPKSGTTSFSNWCDNSAKIALSKPKETFKLCPVFRETHGSIKSETSMFPLKAGAKFRLEGTTLNVYDTQLLETIAKHKNLKVVLIFRDSFKALISWHNQMMKAGFIRDQSMTFETVWKKSVQQANEGIPTDGKALLFRYDLIGKYGFWIEKWLQVLGHERLLLVHNEELKHPFFLRKRMNAFWGEDLQLPDTITNDNQFSALRFPKLYYFLRDSGIKQNIIKMEHAFPALSSARKKVYQRFLTKAKKKSFTVEMERVVSDFFAADLKISQKYYQDNKMYW